MMIPCKDCLVLPACRQKRVRKVTTCSLLSTWWYRPGSMRKYNADLEELGKYLIVDDTDKFTQDKSRW